MAGRGSGRRGAGGVLIALGALLLVGGGVWLWGALRQGPAPLVSIETDRAAVGRATRVVARFEEPARGLGAVRLELVAGDRTVVLGEKSFPRAGAFSFGAGAATPTAVIEAVVGREVQDWLKEGELVLRATADRMAGSLRSGVPVTVERRLPVKLRPPRLELVSSQHYVRQGGAGVVVFRTPELKGGRSGVRAGKLEAPSYPLPGGGPDDRFSLFALPWETGDASQVRVFAEDEAGNRAEAPFVTIFKPSPPRIDKIAVDDAFLEKVVPAIASQTPGFDTRGTLLEQYLRINRELRRENLAAVAALAGRTEPAFLWSGPFLQMKNTAKRANFAETRAYIYQGREIDRQTHLGLDLASLAQAPVPAANRGRVLFSGWLGIYGNTVVLDHGYGLMSLYGHLSALSVKEGEMVEKGQTVANSGATGLAGGDHLHLEIFLHGKSVDPVEWFDEHWIRDNLATKIRLAP